MSVEPGSKVDLANLPESLSVPGREAPKASQKALEQMAQRMGVKPKPRAGTRYAFNNSQKPQTADVPPRSAPPHQGINGGQTEAPKTVTPPESKGGGWRLLLRALPGLIGAGAEGARQAQDYAQRRHDVTQYFRQGRGPRLTCLSGGAAGAGWGQGCFCKARRLRAAGQG